MKLPAKVIAAIAVVVLLAGAGLWAQRSSSSVRPVRLTARDMEVLFREVLPPNAQQQAAASPEEKKKLLNDLRNMFAVAQQAELEGYAERPEVQAGLSFVETLILYREYKKKDPKAQATDEEVKAYVDSHPDAYDRFVRGSKGTRFEIQAQDAQRDEVKKNVSQILTIAERARSEKLDQDETVKAQLLFNRSNVLASTYEGELSKRIENEISDADVDQYYRSRQSDFDQVYVRHILISTEPAPADDGHGHDDEDGEDHKAVTLTTEQARQKAEQVLARIRGGEDFAKVASEVSDDPGSKAKGGEIGFISKGNIQPDFKKIEEVAFSLRPGEVSDVLELPDGFHIVKVGEKKSGPAPADNPGARQSIKEKLKEERIQARIDEIVAHSRVDMAQDFDLTPKPPQQPGAMQQPHGQQQ